MIAHHEIIARQSMELLCVNLWNHGASIYGIRIARQSMELLRVSLLNYCALVYGIIVLQFMKLFRVILCREMPDVYGEISHFLLLAWLSSVGLIFNHNLASQEIKFICSRHTFDTSQLINYAMGVSPEKISNIRSCQSFW